MKYAVVLVVAAVALLGCDQQGSVRISESGRAATSRDDNPAVVGFESNDRAMNAAVADARAHLGYFWEHAAAPAPNEEVFMLKVAFPTPTRGDSAREHIWVSDFEKTASGYTGFLANEPVDIVGKKLGDRTEFTSDMITDWGFNRDGRMIGFYTLRVMLPKMPAQEAAEYRATLGENPK